jgi:peptidoglycan/xylan/chitin deacetylase (PgdA/CDA1 family)
MRAILTYHSIDDSGSPVSLDVGAFRRHVEWLDRGSVRVLSLDNLLAEPESGNAVALTFDDAFVNFADRAAPLLLERGWPVTVFVVTGHVGGVNDWDGRAAPGIPTLPLLGWDALGRLAAAGVTIGSHTRTHPRLPTLAPTQLEDELGESAARIARELGVAPKWFAYPYGDASDGVVAQAGGHYHGAVTTEHRPVGPDETALRLPRLDAWYFRGPAGLAGWGSAAFRLAVWARRQARGARAAVVSARGGP